MASLMQSSAVLSAARKQSAPMPLRICSSQFTAPSRACSSLSTQYYRARSTQSQHCLQSSRSRPSVRSTFPAQQSRTFLAQLRRQSQTLKENTAKPSASTNPGNVKPAAANEPPLQLTNLPYFVRRTASHQLPVYLVTKAGGTKQQTKIQKTEGDVDALRDDLARELGLESGDGRSKKSSDITINRLNGHIIVKGWRKPEITKFLLERNF